VNFPALPERKANLRGYQDTSCSWQRASADLVRYHQCKAKLAKQKGSIEEADDALDQAKHFLTFLGRHVSFGVTKTPSVPGKELFD